MTRSRAASHRNIPDRRRSAGLHVESLEARELLATDVNDPVYRVGGNEGSPTQVVFSWDYREAGYNNDIYYFTVDDEYGYINGLAPAQVDAEAYRAAAQQRGVLLFDGAVVPNHTAPSPSYTKTVTITAGTFISFYVVQNGEGHAWFMARDVNVDREAHFKHTEEGDAGYRADSSLQLSVEDLSNSLSNPRGYRADGDYNDLVFSVFSPTFNARPTIDVDPRLPSPGNQDFIRRSIGPDRDSTPDKSYIWTVTGDDDFVGVPPESQTLDFSIVAGNELGFFEIVETDGETAEIRLVRPRSEMEALVYELTIEVKDQAGNTAVGRVQIDIESTSVGIGGDTQGVEGSGDSINLKFLRESATGNYANQLVVRYNVWFPSNGASPDDLVDDAATMLFLSRVVIIPAGHREATVTIKVAADGILEGVESLYVELQQTRDYAVVPESSTPDKAEWVGEGRHFGPSVDVQLVDAVTRFADGPNDQSDGEPVSLNDIRQGGEGDCFFLAAVAALVVQAPGSIYSGVQDNPSPAPNDFRVRYYGGSGTAAWHDIDFRFDRGPDSVELSGDWDSRGVEIWPHLLEQAFAETHDGYAKINNGGSPLDAWKWLTGNEAEFHDPTAMTPAQVGDAIHAAFSAGKGVMLSTGAAAPGQVTTDHAFAVTAVSLAADGSVESVWIYDPHGKTTEVPAGDLTRFDGLYIGAPR